jgi:hypothetical protein
VTETTRLDAAAAGVVAILEARMALLSGEVATPDPADLVTVVMELLAGADADIRVERLALAGGLIALLIEQRYGIAPPGEESRAQWPEQARAAAIDAISRRIGPDLQVTVPVVMYLATDILNAVAPLIRADTGRRPAGEPGQ